MATKMISVNLPEEILPQIDNAARKEHRSRSQLICDAVRQYLAAGGGRMIPVDDALPDEAEAIARGRAAFERGEFVRLEDLERDLGLTPR